MSHAYVQFPAFSAAIVTFDVLVPPRRAHAIFRGNHCQSMRTCWYNCQRIHTCWFQQTIVFFVNGWFLHDFFSSCMTSDFVLVRFAIPAVCWQPCRLYHWKHANNMRESPRPPPNSRSKKDFLRSPPPSEITDPVETYQLTQLSNPTGGFQGSIVPEFRLLWLLSFQ